MIEPRLDRPRWWEPPPTAEEASSPPAPPPTRDDSQVVGVTSRDEPLPPYLFSPHVVGPKPPPGYSFSAGPKPARFPKEPPTTQRTPEPTATEKSFKNLWREKQKRRGGDNTRSNASPRPSDFSSCGPLCPAFRLASRSNRYDVRLYPRTLWVSYVTVTENRLLAEMEARAGIAEFLGGRNSHGVVLPQTYPHVTQLRYGRVPGLQKQEADFSVSVPLLEGTIQPRPDSNQVVVDYVSKQRVFVTSFWARPWKLTDKTLRLRAKRFIRRLRRHGHSFLDSYFYLAKYDSTESRKRFFLRDLAPPTSLAYVHDLHVYVQTVGGFVLEPGRVADEVTAFRAELDALRLCYRPDQYFVAVYDFIQRYHGRLNEVWLVARRCRG
ncbi:uncharacterized protein LOC119098638 [Pollicipes pollicipes]|uniref:uncharacterized protein LOC119098638 n=1 Tax=Pollicipes pollicipes TaxID=41117 RepID=UPI0018858ECF|nr:uncharacterized protein LOC119098638 [Pollicipes pollicipes]